MDIVVFDTLNNMCPYFSPHCRLSLRPSARIRPNPPVRPNPAELGFGTVARIRPNSDWGRPPESGRKTHKKLPKSEFGFNLARFGFKNEFVTKFLDDSAWFCVEKLSKLSFSLNFCMILHGFAWRSLKTQL